jgi:hypothetical protein
MSPEMLTLVAEVLAYDIARDTCDLLSSTVETEEVALPAGRRSLGVSLKERSWTRLEKDMVAKFGMELTAGSVEGRCAGEERNPTDCRRED